MNVPKGVFTVLIFLVIVGAFAFPVVLWLVCVAALIGCAVACPKGTVTRDEQPNRRPWRKGEDE